MLVQLRDSDDTKEVTSYHTVGGDEGVFMTWKEGKIVHLAAGDDGHWWEIGAYHEHWITAIISCLERVQP